MPKGYYYRNEAQRPVSSFRFSVEAWEQLNDLVAWTEAKSKKEVVERAIREMWMSGCMVNEPPNEE